MYPRNHSEASFVSLLKLLLHKLQTWIRQEIVDDDPWDAETLFSDLPGDLPEPDAEPDVKPDAKGIK